MKQTKNLTRLPLLRQGMILLALCPSFGVLSQNIPANVHTLLPTVAHAWEVFHTPQDSCRTKVWWFHGETETTREGITADLEAFKQAGIGGVVYYDQVHKPSDKALEAMSPEWWRMLKFAAQEAHRLGLTFEINISNGYVIGGKWIEKSEAMQRLVSKSLIIKGKDKRANTILLPAASKDADAYDVAVFAIRLDESKLGAMRSISYLTKASGKSRNGAMNTPLAPDGMMFLQRPDVGVLEASDDSVNWKRVCGLPPVYGSPTYAGQTIGFAPVKARYFRTRVTDPALLKRTDYSSFVRNVELSPIARLTNWEERAGLRSEFIQPIDYAPFDGSAIAMTDILDVTDKLKGNNLEWKTPKGCWMILRIAAEITGGKSKHGRKNLLGLEADKLSPRGVIKHWFSYTQPIIDSLSAIGVKPIGVGMDSHEAGSQNWTQDFAEEFRKRRGYDLRRWLPAMVGYVVESGEKTDSVLADVRLTIADLVCDRYLATIQQLCKQNGMTLTAQAMGNGLSLVADNFRAKGMVDKPQTEFWARDKDGSYDIKEGASAAHRYGKKIASGEAFTDMKFSETLGDVKPLADFAYSCHINEFVVCASAYQPWLDRIPGSTGGGRHYCLNRNNTLWKESKNFWDYQARCAAMMRQGTPVVDMLIKLPSIPPTKLLARRLPDIPAGYSWEVTTEMHDTTTTSLPQVPDLVDYSDHHPKSMLWFSHRRLSDGDMYFITNHSANSYQNVVKLRAHWQHAYFWNPLDGSRQKMEVVSSSNQQMTVPLQLAPNESGFIVLTNEDVWNLPVRRFAEIPKTVLEIGRADMLFDKENVLLKNQPLFDWTTSDNPRIKYFSGCCHYTISFRLNDMVNGQCLLRLPEVSGNVKVLVNGREAGVLWCAPWLLDISRYIKRGANKLELRVDNVLSNRMIGDAGLSASERVTFSQPQIYQADDALKSSGIFGAPIKLEFYEGKLLKK